MAKAYYYYDLHLSLHPKRDKDIINFFENVKANEQKIVNVFREAIRQYIAPKPVTLQPVPLGNPVIVKRNRKQNQQIGNQMRIVAEEYKNSFEEIKDRFSSVFRDFDKWG